MENKPGQMLKEHQVEHQDQIKIMKLSKIILENKKVLVREQLDLSNEDVLKLAKAITNKLHDYLDIDNKTLLYQSVSAAIGDLLQNNEIQLSNR